MSTTLLLVTSNGTGMGHLARQYAVARRAGVGARPAIFSLSLGVPSIVDSGIPAEYCPSYERGWMPRRSWNGYLRDRLVAIVEETGADVVAFDGVAPYPGVINARVMLPEVAFAWIRRGMWRPGTGTKQLKRSDAFDLIIEPGDLAAAADRGPTSARSDAIGVPPISLLEAVEPLGRSDAGAALGLDPERPTALVTLGSGRLGDSVTPAAVALRVLLDNPEWQVAVTRAAISVHAPPSMGVDRVVEVRGVFPLVRYLRVFDAVISAAGYNAVHEFVSGGVPTLLVPNAATRTDDQVARASRLADEGLALTAAEDDASGLEAAIRRLLDPRVRAELAEACLTVPEGRRLGGARRVGEVLAAFALDFIPSRRLLLRRRLRAMDVAARQWIKERLGAGGTARVRRLLGRPDYEGIAADLAVEMTSDRAGFLDMAARRPSPLLFTEELDHDLLRAGPPVEHLLPSSSETYRAARRAVIGRYYDVREGPDDA